MMYAFKSTFIRFLLKDAKTVKTPKAGGSKTDAKSGSKVDFQTI